MPKASGAGSRVPDMKLIEAANVWLNLEESTGKAPALHVARKLGLSVAPEWLESVRFKQILEVARFRRKVMAMQARPEIAGTISELISLGLLEAQRRLILNASEIPSTVLYGDILHKWPKMLREIQAGAKPVASENVFISIVKEINLIADPAARESMRRTILGSLDAAASVVSGALTGGATAPSTDTTGEPIDVEGQLVSVDGVAPVGEPLRLESAALPTDPPGSGTGDGSRLWDDPATD